MAHVPCAEVEPIQHDVSRQHQRDENEPDRFHYADLLAYDSAVSGSTLALTGVACPCWFRKSGPCMISRQINIRNRMPSTMYMPMKPSSVNSPLPAETFAEKPCSVRSNP